MNKVLLIFPHHSRMALSDFQPIGISYLASYVLKRDKRFQVKVLDLALEGFEEKKFYAILRDFAPDVVGISVLALNFQQGAEVARITKKFDTHILVVMGGVHATMRPEECLKYSDVVVRGEGEITFYEILEGRSWSEIMGISYLRDGQFVHNPERAQLRDLDSLPFPAHELFNMKLYSAFPAWGVMGSRGCPYRCIFCNSPQTWGRQVRFRSAPNIVDEIEYLHTSFGVRNIVFFDDTLNIPQKRAIEICDEIIRRGLHKKIDFEAQLRANTQFVSLLLMKKMKDANFRTIGFGIESGSQKVLDSIGKQLTVEEARRAIKLAKEARIEVVKGFFMVGNWDETVADVIKTFRFVLQNDMVPAFSICTPFPGTVFHARLKENGYLKADPSWADFNQTTPITRTNRMPRFAIFLVYLMSIGLQLFVNLARMGKPWRTLSKIIFYAFDSFKWITRSWLSLRRKDTFQP